MLIHPIPTLVFTLWAVDGLLHCNDAERVSCHVGFAIHLLFPTAVALLIAATAAVAGWLIRPRNQLRAWLALLAPTALTWLTLWWALAITAEPGPAPWAGVLGL